MTDRATVQHASDEPLLSIVVPIHNVAAYLDECLESITAQAVQDVEVIMVDDGSTDSSGDIAARWAASDDRFHLIRQDNHGLGHARNSGAAQVRGRYLAFLDSDDHVPEDAYQRMIDALESTGSDFATGNVHRFDSSGNTWQAPLYRGMAKAEELSTHVTRNYELLRDHLAHNKVWRTEFWTGANLQFPVGVLYEDVPTTIPAHVLARSVDVVPVVAILWRVRDQGDSSITQNRGQDAKHLIDRVAAVLTASRFIGEHADQSLKDEYDALVLRRDLRWYVDLYPEVDEEYQREIFSSINRFVTQVSPTALRRTAVAMRVAYALLERNDRARLEEYVALRRADRVKNLPVTVRHGRAVVEVPVGGPALPEDACDITDELTVVSRTSKVAVDDGNLVIEGWAYVSRMITERDQSVAVYLEGNGETIRAEVTYRRDESAAADAGAVAEATGRVAFTARVKLSKLEPTLFQRIRHAGARLWLARVTVSAQGFSLSAPLAKPVAGAAERPVTVQLRDGTWFRAYWTKDGLSCRIRREGVVLDSVRADGDVLEFALRIASASSAGAQLRFRGKSGGQNVPVTADLRDRSRAMARVEVTQLPDWDSGDPEAAWNLLYRDAKVRSWQRIIVPNSDLLDLLSVAGTHLIIRRTRSAAADLVRTGAGPAVTNVEWGSDATLRIRMRHETESEIDAVILSATKQEEALRFPVTADNGELSAELPLGAIARFGETVPVRSGTWDLGIATTAGVGVNMRIGEGMAGQLPATTTYRGRRYTVTDRRLNTLSVVVESDLRPDERGNANQQWLRESYYPSAKTGLRDVVLYESYYGKQFSDSPREVFAELSRRDLGLEHVVAVRDQQFNVPEGASAVAYRSRAYYELLAQAKYIVANTHLPNCFERADGQTVLQTWHGVGTKKIGLDMGAIHFANKSYVDNIRKGEADSWDYLVSPNPFTSPILRRAFAFRGVLLETGVPRNDIFNRPDRLELAAQVKERLGIEQDRKVVMYAPTWRDNKHDGPGRYRLDLRFDLYEAARKLGDDYVLVFRKHSNIIDRLPHGHGAVVDASDYPDVQELLLVTDVLISDYSTLMCDFANTGRPMLFYTYDLVNYRDVLRGFYFDFENEVPGPLIKDQANLVPAILDAQSIRHEYDQKYRAFAQRFCPWDDGHATERVVDAVFGGQS